MIEDSRRTRLASRWPDEGRQGGRLLLHTGSRRSDGIRLGRQHVKNGWLSYTQHKNRDRKPMQVEMPLAPELAAAIKACPSEHLTFLTNDDGQPFYEKSFNTWFREQVAAAGLPGPYVPHGLRKGFARRLAEADVLVTDIAACTGHRTLREVQRYTEKYDRRKGAGRAMAKLAARNGHNEGERAATAATA